MKRVFRAGIKFLLLLSVVFLIPQPVARAELFEASLGFSFTRQNFSAGNFSWNRRWGGSLGLKFSPVSSIELSFQDVVDRNKIIGYEDTQFRDRVYSVNWIQNLFTFAWIQPYFKVGAGQLNREATGEYGNGTSPNPRTDSITAVIGGGSRFYITRTFGIRAEVTSYLTGGSIRTYRDNVGFTVGGSFAF
ncbi:MAG: hypothetical protein RJB38_414 [Pseudomonadota bacterium]|jgi:hypothetical protein